MSRKAGESRRKMMAPDYHAAAAATETAAPTTVPLTVPLSAPAELTEDRSATKIMKDPTSYVGSKVAKNFDGAIYYGTITEYFPEANVYHELWHVKYDDGDEEDYNLTDLEDALKLFETTESSRKRNLSAISSKGCYPIGQAISKYFPGYGKWEGKVVELPTASLPYYDVVYADGDSEHIHVDKLHKYVVVADDNDNKRPAKGAHKYSSSRKTPTSKKLDKQTSNVKLQCIMCTAHGRPSTKFDNDASQFLPVRLKMNGPQKGAPKVTVTYIHACCALRAPLSSPPFKSQKLPEWWTEVAEKTHGYPGLPKARFDSTSPDFVPYEVSFSDWIDEFALYNYRMHKASVRRFDEGRGPPYNFVGSGACLLRCDDRGSIGFARMAPQLVQRAKEEVQLSSAEAALWGAILYRCFNRLSTFSRWAAVKALAAKLKLPVSAVLKRTKGKSYTSLYEAAVHGPPQSRQDEFHTIAASGVTLLGRSGFRDKWGKDFCSDQMTGRRSPICCVAELPLSSELCDFKTFLEWEVWQGRGIMTGEHQVQSRTRVVSMLGRLAANQCSRLKKLSCLIQDANSAETVLDALRELDTVGAFFSWQILSDLVSIQYHTKLFPVDGILPTAVVRDSFFNYCLFGPGARKGAYILDGGAAEVLEFDRDANQASTLDRAKRILAEWPAALQRTKLDKSWAQCSGGRPYDLETCEHSLCGFYGVLPVLITKVITIDNKTSKSLEMVARKANCVWPPDKVQGTSHSAGTREMQGGGSWKPNPSTALERQDLRRMVKAAKVGEEGIKREEHICVEKP